MPVEAASAQPKPMALIIEEQMKRTKLPPIPRPDDAPLVPADITADGQTAEILKGRGIGERGKYKMGAASIKIQKFQLFLDYGYPTMAAYVEHVLDNEPNINTLRQYAAVAERFTEDDAADLTCHKLFHLITYGERKGVTDLSNPGDLVIEVLAEPEDESTEAANEPRWVKKTVSKCSKTEIERTLAALAPKKPAPADDLDGRAQSLEHNMTVFLGSDTHVRVEVVKRPRGSVLRVDNLTAEEADRLELLLLRG